MYKILQAVFPALEKLYILRLGNISEIWDKKFKPVIMKEGTGSFSQLRSLEVIRCHRLMNVVPSNLAPRLSNLETLKVHICDSVVHEVEDLTAVFPRLKRLSLYGLDNLRETGLKMKEDSLQGIDNVVYPNINNIFIVGNPNLESLFSASTSRNLAHLGSFHV